MKSMKKIVSVIVMLAMVLSVFPIAMPTVSAADDGLTITNVKFKAIEFNV